MKTAVAPTFIATDKLRRVRMKTGLNLMEFSKSLNLDSGNYSRIETMRRRVSPRLVKAVAEALGMTPAEAIESGLFKY